MRVLLNCAVDADGRMAGPGGKPTRISCDVDLRRVHALRAESDAILVGVETVLRDDPSLRVKPELATGTDPTVVVMDRRLRTPPDARCIRPGTRIYHESAGSIPGATCIQLPQVTPAAVCADLAAAGFHQLMVEGGPTVLEAFREAGCWNDWTIYQSTQNLGDGPRLRNWPAGGRRAPLGDGMLWSFSP